MAAALHNKLLTDIAGELDVESPEYESFVYHMTEYVPKGLLKSKPTILAKFDAMKSKGKLDIGKYEYITKVAELSGNNDILELIETRKSEIIEALEREKTGQKAGTDTAVRKKRKPEEETDHSDPLYGFDSRGKGKYDTAGKRGYLLILNNTYKRLDTGNDVRTLQSFFRDELKFDVNTISNDLSKEDVFEELRKAREKLKNDTERTYYAFICTILTHGNKTGLQFKNKEVIKVDEIWEFFCEGNAMSKFAGRPKLFFIESCRGDKAQDLHEVDDADDIVDMSDDVVHIPFDADTLVACSSTQGYGSYGDSSSNRTRYTYFINALCEIFRTNYKTDHVEDMLISVREKIALDKNPVYDNDANVYTKQMPCTQTTLTKRLYLTAYTGPL